MISKWFRLSNTGPHKWFRISRISRFDEAFKISLISMVYVCLEFIEFLRCL